jgi:hypothetical protein
MKKPVLIVAVLAALGAAWAVFRPELLFINEKVNEGFPQAAGGSSTSAGSGQVLAQGSFQSGAHETKGSATVHQLGDGSRVLRLSGFQTSNGPDVRVLLVAAETVKDSDTVKTAGYRELGKLKGNVGDQNYDIPADIDLAKYRAVSIWCNRFSVNFGAAALAE